MDGVFESTIFRVGAVVVASVAALGVVGFLKNKFEDVNSTSTSPSANRVIHIKTRAEFVKYVSTREGSAVVDYSAEWCAPCKAIAPTYEKLSGQYPKTAFLHVDIDELAAEIPEIAGVRGVPTFMFYKDGAKVSEFSGANKQKLEESVKKIAA